MYKFLFHLTFVIFIIFIQSCTSSKGVEVHGRTEIQILGVSDGDTLNIREKRGGKQKLRLFGIDAPEKGQPFAEKARQFLSGTLSSSGISMRTHETDRYGRQVAELFLADGRSVNVMMLEAGLAFWYTRYAERRRDMQMAEAAARKARRGIWSLTRPELPWEFRQKKREKAVAEQALR